MARVKRSGDLGSIEARRKLKIRPEPYFHVLEKGLALGYRKSSSGGTWLLRRYDPATKRNSETRVASADDYREADGVEVLSFSQAQRKILIEAKDRAEVASGKHYNVADAVEDYLAWLRDHKKSAADEAIKLKAYVLEAPIAAKRLSDLTPVDFDGWIAWALKRTPKRKPKTRKSPQKIALKVRPSSQETSKASPPTLTADEQRRRRRATINRVITPLKACLNHAFSRRKVGSNEAWLKLKKFKRVDSAHLRWLTEDEVKRLLNASEANFRTFAQAALMSGAGPGELAKAEARDFDSRTATLLVQDSKTRPARRIPLTDEGLALFESCVAGLKSHDLIFTRGDGTAWYRTAWIRAIQEASNAARIVPAANYYALRHTYASHLAKQGVPLLYIANALGHKDTRMVEKHYAHLQPSHVAETIRANLPSFGLEADTKVKALRPR